MIKTKKKQHEYRELDEIYKLCFPNKDFDKLFRESENITRLFFKNSKTKEYLEWHRLFVFEKFNFVDV